MPKIKSSLRVDLRILLAIVAVLILIGLVFIYSSSSIYALDKFGRPHYFLKKQFMHLLIGLGAFTLFASTKTSFWHKYAPLLFVGSLFFSALTFIPGFGVKIHGSSRWLNIAGFSLQPSAFLKLFLLLYLGFFLEKKFTKIKSFIYGYLPFLIILGVTFLVLLKQPDFGSVVTLFITSFMLFFIAGFKESHLLITVLSLLPVAGVAVFFVAYRLQRILIFLNPWSDPQGRGYQIIQSLIAIGSGGFLGKGISYSTQKFFYLPMLHTDFIFSIIAEEIGFVGCFFIILLFIAFCFFGFRIALQLKSTWASYTTMGFVILITLEAAINMMVVSALVPTKGLGLPFISYGGSALIANLSMIGLIVNFARQQRRIQE